MAAPVIVTGIVIAAIVTFIVGLDSGRKVFWPPPEKPTAAPPSTAPAAPPSSPPSQPRPTPEKTQPPKDTTAPPAAAPRAPKATEPASTTAPRDRIFAHCQIGLMPLVVPPEGRFHVLLTSDLPAEMRGGGLMDYFAKPGSEWKWNNDGLPAWAYRCEWTNYSADVLFNLSIPAHLTFRTPMPVPGQEKARSQGAVTLDRDWVFDVPKLDPSPGSPFVFYIWNCCVQKFVQVRFPDFALTKTGRIPIIQSDGNLFQALNPVPFN